jgi:putative transposase
VRYACIRAHENAFPVTLMCRVLQVSRSGFYAWKRRPPSVHTRKEDELRAQVHAAYEASKRNYGSPRVHRALRADGVRTSRKRVERLMREEGLRAKQRRRYVVTTDSRFTQAPAPNVLARRFAPEEVAATNRVWVADITYVPTPEGWLYLAVLLDLASRIVVGWSMSESLNSALASDALDMALQRRRPDRGLLHHSDQGVQYACTAYQELLAHHGICPSMSRRGNCWDNAVAESFFATLERELIDDARWLTRDHARAAVFVFIEAWYNRQRLHSSLDYLSPTKYEEQLQLKQSAA